MTRNELIQTLDGLMERDGGMAVWRYGAYVLALSFGNYLTVKRAGGQTISELDGQLVTQVEVASGNLCVYAYGGACDTEVYLGSKLALVRVTYHDHAQNMSEFAGRKAQNMSEEQKRPSDASKTVGQESTQAEPKTKPEGRISSSVRTFMNGRLRMRARTCDGASGTRVFHAYGNILQWRY